MDWIAKFLQGEHEQLKEPYIQDTAKALLWFHYHFRKWKVYYYSGSTESRVQIHLKAKGSWWLKAYLNIHAILMQSDTDRHL